MLCGLAAAVSSCSREIGHSLSLLRVFGRVSLSHKQCDDYWSSAGQKCSFTNEPGENHNLTFSATPSVISSLTVQPHFPMNMPVAHPSIVHSRVTNCFT